MKKTLLTVFASLLTGIGVLLLTAFTFFGWGTWSAMPGGVGWLDFQLNNKTQIPFFARALALLIAGVLFWLLNRRSTKSEAEARWTNVVICGVALAFAFMGVALYSLPQADFLYRNESSLQTIRTMLYILVGVLLIIGSFGTIARQRKAYWLLVGWMIVGVCINFANLVVVVAYPIIISGTRSSQWLTGWGIEALFFLTLDAIALALLLWMHSEISPPGAKYTQTTDTKSSLGLT